MKKIFFICLLVVTGIGAEAQVHGRIIIGPRYGYGYRRPPVRVYSRPPVRSQQYQQYQQRPQLPPFQPSVNISFGYGYPNLDYTHFAQFYNLYKGNATAQTGPFTGAIDYQFSRYMSIGVLGTYGKVSQPYFATDNTSNVPDLTGSYENWSLMLNVVSYFPTRTRAVSPYLRTAIGVNNWKQDYTDAAGAKTLGIPTPSTLAYQASLGAKFNLSPRAGIFLEAGYGKYIVNGGLALKF
jgi:hypothetical protein